jgi:3'-phosphoadenosine 5'-phosphosulfate sulfotransferase (PAPS reductase)/FAD synthetase
MPTTTEEYAELANTINEDLGKVKGSPQRLSILLGMWGKEKTAIIPNKEDRSRYAMENYKFLLDAPFYVSDKCCNVMKKKPSHDYARMTGRKPIIATMASESNLRTQKWLQQGCNSFDSKYPASKPMSFWTEQDVLLYIKENNLPIASVYGEVVVDYEAEGQLDGQMDMFDLGIFDKERRLLKTTGCSRTGCMFCGYGCHLEKSPNRFERMKETHPKQYDYIMRPTEQGGLGYKEIIDWINENGDMNIKY